MLRKPHPSQRAGKACPILGFHQTVGGKYKLRLLYELLDGPRRYGELRKELISASQGTPVTARVLSRELKELEARGLIDRKQFPVVPPKVEYSLTKLGGSLAPVIEAIALWGITHGAKSPRRS